MSFAFNIPFKVERGETNPYDAEVEYLESTGTQYIDTEIAPTITTYLSLSVMFPSAYTSLNQTLCGAGNSGGSYQHLAINCRNGFFTVWNGSVFFQSSVVVEANKLYDLAIVDGAITVNDIRQTMSRHTKSYADYPMYIFCDNAAGVPERRTSQKLYYFKIYEGEDIVADFIPVRVGTDGLLYDRVRRKLFSNQGTGEFTIGPDKN